MKRGPDRPPPGGCGRARRLLSERLDDELSLEDGGWLATHVSSCEACRNAQAGLDRLSAVAIDLGRRDRSDTTVDLVPRVLGEIEPAPPWWTWLFPRQLAGLSVALAVALVFTVGLPETFSLPVPPPLGLDLGPGLTGWPGSGSLPSVSAPVTLSPPPLMSLVRQSLMEEVSR